MGVEETKRDLWLKRAQITVALLAALTTLIVGAYNVKKTFFAETGPGTLALRVVADSGQGIAGARVEIFADGAMVGAGETGPSGDFRREGLDPGDHVVKARRSGYEPEAVTVRIHSKKTTEADLSLRAVAGTARPGGALASALEESAASWIKKIGTAKDEQAS